MASMWEDVFGQHFAGASTGVGVGAGWSDVLSQQLEQAQQTYALQQQNQIYQQMKGYVPPRSFEQKVDYLISMLERFGPKIEVMAKVYEAMNIPEEDKK